MAYVWLINMLEEKNDKISAKLVNIMFFNLFFNLCLCTSVNFGCGWRILSFPAAYLRREKNSNRCVFLKSVPYHICSFSIAGKGMERWSPP